MKLIVRYLMFLALWVSTTGALHGQTTEWVWQQKSNFIGGKIEGAVTFTSGGMGYVCLANSGKDCWRYDPKKDEWKKLTDFPGDARKGAAAFSVGNRVYLGTGATKSENDNTDLKDLWEYDPATDHWEHRANLPGGARHGAIAFSIGAKGYIGLGGQSGRASNYTDLWEYDPKNDKWLKKCDIPGDGRSNASVFVINKDAYVLFGEQGMQLSMTANKMDVYKYGSENNTWVKCTDFPGSPRTGATVFTLNNKGYVFAGTSASQRYDDFWEYDPTAKSWTEQKPDSLPVARNNAFCFSIDSAVYVGTGKIKNSILGSCTNDVWRLSTQTNIDFKAKLLYQSNHKNMPLGQQGVSLVSQQKVLQTTTTDSTGAFGFKKIDMDKKYVLVLDKNDKLPANAVVSIAKPSGKIVMNLEKNTDGQFEYEVSKIDFLSEDDSYFNLQYFMKSADSDISITSHISYATGSAELSDDAKNILYQVIVSLNQYPNLVMEVSSHTDAVGSEEENMKLSEKRAKVVVDYIVSNGINAKRISGKGYGATQIINKCKPCSDEENAVNRRTEFKFIKK
jgi:outer membrane protein OmpA-like peptidoglycan-associated protein/N-acetylneuraminic acid mutarotase